MSTDRGTAPPVGEFCPDVVQANGGLQGKIVNNVLESMPSGLMIVGGEGRVMEVNTALAEILGHPRETLIRKGWGVLFIEHAENSDFNNILLDVIQQEQVLHRRQVWYIRPDGQKRYLEIISSFLREDRKNWGLVVLVQDLTDLRLLHDRETQALEQKRIAEQQRADSLNNLALSIAHQIRNPIMAIGGFTKMALQHKENPAKVATYLETVRDAALQLERMAKAVRQYVAIGPARPEVIVLDTLLARAWPGMQDRALAKGASLASLRAGVPGVAVYADPAQLAQALDEVLENALEAYDGLGAAQRSVLVASSLVDDMVAITVTDQGRGIPEADMPYVRDPFFTTKPCGAGMGLATVERILAGNRGLMEIVSRVGQGTTVTLRLPAAGQDLASP